MNSIIVLSAIHLEWVYTPEDLFQNKVTEQFDGGTIYIGNGKVLAKIDSSAFQARYSEGQQQDMPIEELAEELDDQIYALVKRIEDKLEILFQKEEKGSQKSYQLSLLFKVFVRNDGSEKVLYA